ncbi:MAG: ROK family transcriptional regulator [Treponemataceae bacterium]|nr:ROK family transcriptional regulator [Treponemataceae bacterium]
MAQTIWRHPGISRIDIARSLNLYRSTVTNIIQNLLEAGIVYEAEEGEATSQGGRRPILLRINEKMGCIGGIEIQPDFYRAVIVNVYGHQLYKEEKNIEGGSLADMVVFIFDHLRSIIETINLPLLGIGIALPGIINPDEGIIIQSDPFNLTNFNFYKEISPFWPIPLAIENDANCCAWEDLTRYRYNELEDFVSVLAEYHVKNPFTGVRSGVGVGIGIALGGKIHYGKRYAAGEFTSMLWNRQNTGQFELDDKTMLNVAIDKEAFKKFLIELFKNLKPIVSVFDPEVLFFHGEVCKNQGIMLDLLKEDDIHGLKSVLERVGCRIEFSSSDPFDVAQGAASMFINRLFSIPELMYRKGSYRIKWEEIFELVKNGV